VLLGVAAVAALEVLVLMEMDHPSIQIALTIVVVGDLGEMVPRRLPSLMVGLGDF
jgi:hypothetical protein